jgi:hypothetical protein
VISAAIAAHNAVASATRHLLRGLIVVCVRIGEIPPSLTDTCEIVLLKTGIGCSLDCITISRSHRGGHPITLLIDSISESEPPD